MDTRTRSPLAARVADIAPFHVMEVQTAARALEAAGRTVVHMEIGEPDFPTPAPVLDAARAALDHGGIYYTSALGLPEGAVVAATIANLIPLKNHSGLLRAVATARRAVSPLHVVLVGGGDTAAVARLRSEIETLGLDGVVHYLGTRSDVPAILQEVDFLVVPSVTEGFSMVAAEAMAAGLPVVGTRVGGVPEIIGSPDVGRLVPRGGADAMADAVIGILRDPTVLAGMRKAAHARAKSHFHVEGWADRLTAMYRTVLEEANDDRPKVRTYARLNVELLRPKGPARPRVQTPRRAQRQPKKSRYAALSTSSL